MSRKILIVEDDEAIATGLSLNLRLAGLQPQVVRDGEEALTTILSSDLDLVLLDINMPKKTGLEVLIEIKSDPRFRPLPVVMLTVSEREEDIVRSFEQGACSYIRKPVTFSRFLSVVKEFELYWTLVSRVPTLKR